MTGLKEELTQMLMESYDKGVADTKKAAEEAIVEAVAFAIKQEREACAKECEDEIKRVKPIYSVVAENVLKAIRARGEK